MRRRSSVWLALLVLTLAPRWARADRAVAEEHYKRGMAAYALDDYDGAVAEFEKAFREEPFPALLFNMAQAHRRANHHEQALRFYKKYLELAGPHVPDAAKVKKEIRELEKLVEQDKANAPAPLPPPAAATTATPAAPTAEHPPEAPSPPPPANTSAAPPPPVPVVASPSEDAPTAPVRTARPDAAAISLWVVGAVVAGAGAGLVVYGDVTHSQAVDPARKTDLADRDTAVSTANVLAGVGYGAIGLGVAAVVSGVVEYLVVRGRPTSGAGRASAVEPARGARLRWAVDATSERVGVGLRGSF